MPAALSHDIGSDSQRPFAIVIVGGLLTELVLSLVLLPAFYAWMAGPNDVLPEEAEEAPNEDLLFDLRRTTRRLLYRDFRFWPRCRAVRQCG